MNYSIEHSVIRTNPEYSSNNSPPVGIGHLASCGEYLIVNNIDHNSEIWHLEQSLLRPIAVCNQTIYPEDIENAGFDLDIHAVFYDEQKRSLMMLNHFGRLQCFDIGSFTAKNKPEQLTAVAEALWIADVEQTLRVRDCLISTSPGDYHVPESARPGLFVSAPLSISQLMERSNNVRTAVKLDYMVHFVEMGEISAIATNANEDLLAVASGQNLLIMKVTKQNHGDLSLNNIVTELGMDFYCRYVSFWKDKYIICAGHDLSFEDNVHNPESLKAGGFMVVDIQSHKILFSTPFKCDLAWGNGGQCLIIDTAKDDLIMIGIDRHANLWAWNWPSMQGQLISKNSTSEDRSYGIAHLARSNNKLFCGFNRDGARLHMYDLNRL